MNKGRQLFLSKLKKYEKSMSRMRDYLKDEYVAADGKAEVDVCLFSGQPLYNPFSMGRQRELSSELYDWIDTKIYPVPNGYQVRLRLHVQEMEDAEKAQIEDILHEHYAVELRDKRLDLRINFWKIWGLIVVGVCLLGLYFALEVMQKQQLFMEFLSIAGTFALWEAVDLYLLERRTLQLDWFSAGQAVMSEIVFVEDEACCPKS